jgi:opacity protein-like surface antigen
MKMMIAAAVAATAALAPAFAQAQDAAPTGAYATLGYAYTSSKGLDLGAVQLRGGYLFHKWVGVEAEAGIGVDDDKEIVLGVVEKYRLKHQLAAYVVGYLPMSETADLFARVGYGTTKVRLITPTGSASDSEDSFNVGAGGQVHFDGKNGIRIEYLHSNYDGRNASTYSLSYSHRF